MFGGKEIKGKVLAVIGLGKISKLMIESIGFDIQIYALIYVFLI